MVKQFVTHTIFLTKYLAWGIMHYRLVRRKCYSLYRYSVANLPDLKIFGSQFTNAKQISLHKDIIMIKKCVIHNNKINHLGVCLCKSFLLVCRSETFKKLKEFSISDSEPTVLYIVSKLANKNDFFWQYTFKTFKTANYFGTGHLQHCFLQRSNPDNHNRAHNIAQRRAH